MELMSKANSVRITYNREQVSNFLAIVLYCKLKSGKWQDLDQLM